MVFGVYVHWPFCASKCPYCDFNSHVHAVIDQAKWRQAYEREIAHTASLTTDREVSTIFFGGGTPSLMEPETTAHILNSIRRHWPVSDDCEITLEANPNSVDTEKFEGFRAAGINRVSLGVQSLRGDDLKFLGRTHDVDTAKKGIDIARKTFDRFSFDLIYARPHQTLNAWREELLEAIDIGANHISLYQLTIEQHTPFYTQFHRGEFQIPDQDAAADLHDLTQEIMHAADMPCYEVSNHARAGEESKHNLIYWRSDDYAGIGPGAHGRLTLNGKKHATRGHRAPDIWLDRALNNGHGLHDFELITQSQNFDEIVMMGLRLREGIPWARLSAIDPEHTEIFKQSPAIKRMCDEGYIGVDQARFWATGDGLKRLNAVLGYILTT